jgi:Cytochrome c7 and related cytochrome c
VRIAHRERSSASLAARAAAIVACVTLALAGSGAAAADVDCLLASPDFDRSTCSSSACLSCHDGTCAAAVSSERSHPVDRVYATGWLARRVDLRSIPDRELVLADGLITCASCHDGASALRHRTAVPVARLCQGCHDR